MNDRRQTVSVSEINEYLKTILSSDQNLTGLFIRGELSNFTHHLKSGHFYFTLKDEKSSIKAVMFRGAAQYVKFKPENGMKVIIFGSIRVFERDGVYQIYCEDIEPDGLGALYMALNQLKEKLEKKGYFSPEHKKALPQYPNRIAVITAWGGAALQDMIRIVSRRYPAVSLTLFAAAVQGKEAVSEICGAFDRIADLPDDYFDVVILARGGGSMEDLSAFNDERVADAVFRCKIPVISAVGHETDFTIADFVADVRVPTPSAAAEIAVPDRGALIDLLDNYQNILYNYTSYRFSTLQDRLEALSGRVKIQDPGKRIDTAGKELMKAFERLNGAIEKRLTRLDDRLKADLELLNAYNPLNVLSRGYSITFHEGKTVTDSASVSPGDIISTRLNNGLIISEVKKSHE